MAQSTISQRIALEGAEDILKQLADLGQAGEKAVKQIQDASAGMSSTGLAGLSGLSALAQSEFGKVSTALAPVTANFAALEEAAKGVGERILSVASVLGVGLVGGLAGGIAGLVELVKSSAEAGHQLEIQAGTIGITVEQLQAYRKVAADAGVDGDRVFTALVKLTQNLGKETEKLSQDTIKAFADLPTSLQSVGTAVVRGLAPAGPAIKSGIVDTLVRAKDAVNQYVDQFVKAAAQQGKAFNPAQIEQYRQGVQAAASDTTKLGEAFRLAAAATGVLFPALTQGEELKRNAEIAKDPVLALGVSLKDLQANSENLDPVIRKIFDGLAAIKDPAIKNVDALALLGRSAKELGEAFKGGSASLDEALAALKGSGLGLTPEQAALLAEAEKGLTRLGSAATGLRNQLAVIFAPALIDVTKTFTDLIKNNADVFKGWASVIATEVLPGIKNLIEQFTGAGNAAKGAAGALPGAPAQPGASAVGATEPPPGTFEASGAESARQSLIALRDAAVAAGSAISTAFTTLRGVLTTVATAINAVFGTMLTASGLAAVLIVGQLVGAFALLLPLLGLAAALIAALGTPIGIAVALIAAVVFAIVNWRSVLDGLRGAVAAVAQGISGDFNKALGFISSLFGTISGGIQSLASTVAPAIAPIFTAITDVVTGAIAEVAPLFSGLWSHVGDGLSLAITAVREAFDSLTSFVTKSVQIILGALRDVGDFVSSIASKLASLGASAAAAATGGGGGGGSSDPGGLGADSGSAMNSPGFAAGGGVGRFPGRPRGTDTVPAWLTPGEFVVRMQAVRHYGSDFFHALNSMRMPFDALRGFSLGGFVDAVASSFAPAPQMLAAGGPVYAASGGSMNSLTLNLSGENFALDVAPGHVYDKLARHARSSAIRSAGRKPSWYAG